MSHQKIQEWAVLVEKMIRYLPRQEAYENLIEFLIRTTNSLEGVVMLWHKRERSWETLPASFVPKPKFQKDLEQVFKTASPDTKVNPGQIHFPLFDSQQRVRGVLCLVRESQPPFLVLSKRRRRDRFSPCFKSFWIGTFPKRISSSPPSDHRGKIQQ